MRRTAAFILTLMLVACTAPAARGDLYTACDASERAGNSQLAISAPGGTDRAGLAEVGLLVSDSLHAWAAESLPVTLPPAVADAAPEVRELPGLAGSASLFVSAMLSMGAWQVVRSAKRFHLLGAFPEWYHTGGPFQIGHAVAIDFNFQTPPLCCFDVPDDGGGAEPSPERLRGDDRPSCWAGHVVAPMAPRAPPHSC